MCDHHGVTRPSPSLRGQHIVIIGDTSGVGYAAADCALAEGAQVTIATNRGAALSTSARKPASPTSLVALPLSITLSTWSLIPAPDSYQNP